jgi:hypothetical protein
MVVLKKTPEGYLIVPFQEEFRRLITRTPRRTGTPKFLSPEEMKKIWEPKV